MKKKKGKAAKAAEGKEGGGKNEGGKKEGGKKGGDTKEAARKKAQQRKQLLELQAELSFTPLEMHVSGETVLEAEDSKCFTNIHPHPSNHSRSSAKAEKRKAIKVAMEELRTTHYTCFGPERTVHNVLIFTICFGIILLLRTALSFYIFSISDLLRRRFFITTSSINFIQGMQKVGFIIVLIFVAFYGNMLHKPVVILCGALTTALGGFLCILPQFGTCSVFDSGPLAMSGKPQILFSTCLAPTWKSEDWWMNGTCIDELPRLGPNDATPAFQLLSIGEVLIGMGSGAMASIGFIYMDEAGAKEMVPFNIGIALCLNGLGELLGVLMHRVVGISQGSLLMIEGVQVGSWWVGCLILSILLILASFSMLVFPRFIEEPKWLLLQRLKEKRYKEEKAAYEKDLRRRLRAKKKARDQRRQTRRETRLLQAEDFEGLKKVKEQAAAAAAADEAQNVNDNANGNVVEPTDDTHDSIETINAKESMQNNKPAADGTGTGNDQRAGQSSPADAERATTPASSKLPHETDKKEEVGAQQAGQEPTSMEQNKEMERNDSRAEGTKRDVISPVPDTTGANAEPEPHKSLSAETMEDKIEEQKDEQEAKDFQQQEKQQARKRLGRKLKDLPQNLWFLLTHLVFLVPVLGCTAALYLQAGFYPIVPQYLHMHFYYAVEEAAEVAGIIFGLSQCIGPVVAGYLIRRFKLNLQKQYKLAFILLSVTIVGIFILFPLGCQKTYFMSEAADEPLTGCSTGCDCEAADPYDVCLESTQEVFPSPCHAGCKKVEDDDGVLVFKDCMCKRGESQSVSSSWCSTSCPAKVGFGILLFIAMLTQSGCHVTAVLTFLRVFPERMRSLSVGFALWLAYLLAYVPGVAVYDGLTKQACSEWLTNAQGFKTCWRYRTDHHRYSVNGVSVVCQILALVCLAAAYFKVIKFESLKEESKRKDPSGVEDLNALAEQNVGEDNPTFKGDTDASDMPAVDTII